MIVRRTTLLLVGTANLLVAAYLLGVEHTFRGPPLLIVLGAILIVKASMLSGRKP